MAWFKDGAKAGDWTSQNGWTFTLKTGSYGIDYLQRALVTAIGLGANLPQDAVVSDLELPTAPSSPTAGTSGTSCTLRRDKRRAPMVSGR